MIYYGKTLFGSGPKLTAVHPLNQFARLPIMLPLIYFQIFKRPNIT